MFIFRAVSLIAMLMVSSSLYAADPLTDAIQHAYGPYRLSLFKTNSNSQTESKAAIRQAQEMWTELVAQFGQNPPAPYNRDAQLNESLSKVSTIYHQAAEEIEHNKLVEAHKTLEAIRDVLAEVRQRNGVVVFSDHMNAYHSQMELVIGKGLNILKADNGRMKLMGQVAVLDYLAKRLQSEAPVELSNNNEFTAGLQAIKSSVEKLETIVLSGDEDAIQAAIKSLKKPYSLLFIKFG